MNTLPIPQTILVIDDDAAMRMILTLSLKLFGYVTLSAEDGESALSITREHPEIRVILLDVVMCGLSGRALAGQLEANLPNSSVLFCSGHPAAALPRYGIDANSINFLQKPLSPCPRCRKRSSNCWRLLDCHYRSGNQLEAGSASV